MYPGNIGSSSSSSSSNNNKATGYGASQGFFVPPQPQQQYTSPHNNGGNLYPAPQSKPQSYMDFQQSSSQNNYGGNIYGQPLNQQSQNNYGQPTYQHQQSTQQYYPPQQNMYTGQPLASGYNQQQPQNGYYQQQQYQNGYVQQQQQPQNGYVQQQQPPPPAPPNYASDPDASNANAPSAPQSDNDIVNPWPYPPTTGPEPGPFNQYTPAPQPSANEVAQYYAAHHFAPSTLSGNRKSLLIGINYRGQRNELKGCINDVINVRNFIATQYGFPTDNEHMLVLTEDQPDQMRHPTRQNMLAAMRWLVMNARPGDSLFFHYSGHGGQKKDVDGDEMDGYDETVMPIDYQSAGVIIDDEMHAIMVQPLPSGVRLTAIFDCCHSGTALDLPYIYASDGSLKVYNPLKSAAMSTLQGVMRGGLIGGLMKGVGAVMNGELNSNVKEEDMKRRKTALADVIMISGCKDTQTSADATMQGFGRTGAMSYSFVTSLNRNRNQSFIGLLQDMRNILVQARFDQVPQLSSGRPMNMNTYFTM